MFFCSLKLLQSIDWHSNELHFGFFFGFDKADEMYDTGDAWSDIREYFRERYENICNAIHNIFLFGLYIVLLSVFEINL